MAITALVKSSTLVVKPKAGMKGTEDIKNALKVEVSGPPTFSDSYDTIERDVVRQAFSTYAPLRGLETTSGTVTLELHGSGTINQAPESTLLWKSALGSLSGPAGTKSSAWMQVDKELYAEVYEAPIDDAVRLQYVEGTDTKFYDPDLYVLKVKVNHTLDMTTAKQLGFEVGFPVRIHNNKTDDTFKVKYIGFIVAMEDNATDSNSTLYILSELSYDTAEGAPDFEPIEGSSTGGKDVVDCGFLYLLHNQYQKDANNNWSYPQVLATPEINFDYYRGNIVREEWMKALATELSIDFSTGQVCLPAINWEGSEVSYADGGYHPSNYSDTSTDPIYSEFDSINTTPLVVQLADIFIQDFDSIEHYDWDVPANNDAKVFFQECISNIQITLTNEVFKKQCIASTGIGEVIRTSRSVTGSLNTFYTGKDFQDAFKNNKKYWLRAIFNFSSSLEQGKKKFTDNCGNIVAIGIPKLAFSEVSIEEDTGIFKYANSFSAEPINGDDEFLIAFL